MKLLLCTTFILLIGFLVPELALSADLRLYTANKQLQQRRISMIRDTDEPGCHNLIKKRRVYRAAQIGYLACTLYSEKDCETGTEVEVRWKNEEKTRTGFTRGARWFLPGERGSKIASWKCDAEP